MGRADRTRFLIVDDSPSARAWLRDQVAGHGRVDEAEDGYVAVQRFDQALEEGDPYAVVFLDILMPHLDGHGAARRMQQCLRDRGVPEARRPRLVMVTALDDPAQRIQAHFEEGAALYLPKPLTAAAVQEALANLGLAPCPIAPAAGGSAEPLP